MPGKAVACSLQLCCSFRVQGGVQDGLNEVFEGNASGFGGQGEGGGFGEAWDGFYVQDPGCAFGEDGVHAGVAGAAENPVGGERHLLYAGGVFWWYLRGDGEVGGTGSVFGLEVVGAFAGSYFDEAQRPRVFTGGLDDGKGYLRSLHPALEQDLGVVP